MLLRRVHVGLADASLSARPRNRHFDRIHQIEVTNVMILSIGTLYICETFPS
jgi:hypothetical protein